MSGSSYVGHNLGLRDADGGITDLSSIKPKSRKSYSHLVSSVILGEPSS